MSANEYAKAQSICADLAAGASQLIAAIDNLLAIKAKKDGTGYDLTDNGFEAHLSTTAFKYITDGTDFNNVMASSDALKTWLVNNFHWDVFQKVRP